MNNLSKALKEAMNTPNSTIKKKRNNSYKRKQELNKSRRETKKRNAFNESREYYNGPYSTNVSMKVYKNKSGISPHPAVKYVAETGAIAMARAIKKITPNKHTGFKIFSGAQNMLGELVQRIDKNYSNINHVTINNKTVKLPSINNKAYGNVRKKTSKYKKPKNSYRTKRK